jgi:hypothetical protein
MPPIYPTIAAISFKNLYGTAQTAFENVNCLGIALFHFQVRAYLLVNLLLLLTEQSDHGVSYFSARPTRVLQVEKLARTLQLKA